MSTFLKNKEKKVDWTTLEKGDRIKVIKGSGPYYIMNKNKIPIGDYGVFTVKSVDPVGIFVYNKYGNSFLYMGKIKFNDQTNVVRRPYKIVKLK